MNINAVRLPNLKVSVLPVTSLPSTQHTVETDENKSPPLDPTYVASIDARGRIIHYVDKFQGNEPNKHAEQKASSAVGVNNNDNNDNNNDNNNNNNNNDDVSTQFAPPDVANGNPTSEERKNQAPTTTVFRAPKIKDLTDDVEDTKQTKRHVTQILSLSEARAKQQKEEEQKRANEIDKQQEKTIAELLAQTAGSVPHESAARNREEAKHTESLQNLRAQEWNYWSTMPTAIAKFEKQWRRNVQQQNCAACRQPMCVLANLDNGVGDTETSEPVFSSIAVGSNDSTYKPWNAELAADDIDLCAVRCMRKEAETQVIRCARNVHKTGDAWMLLPCQHVLHGFPCVMQHIVSEKRECPECNKRVSQTVKALDAVLLAEHQNADETNNKQPTSALQKIQNKWLLNEIVCPPTLLKKDDTIKCSDIVECKCVEHVSKKPGTPDSNMASRAIMHVGTDRNDNGSVVKPNNNKTHKTRKHLLEVIDKAQQRLVRKYVLLDSMQAALDAADTAEFRVYSTQLQMLVPQEAQQRLWQILEPPREYRPNVQRAVSLAKSAATLSSEALQWLSDHGFLDKDTMTVLAEHIDEQWFAGLTDNAQRILLSQAIATATLDLWNVSLAAHVRAPSTLHNLARKKQNAHVLTQWATIAEQNGRFAVAVEMRDLASNTDTDTHQ